MIYAQKKPLTQKGERPEKYANRTGLLLAAAQASNGKGRAGDAQSHEQGHAARLRNAGLRIGLVDERESRHSGAG